MFKSVKTAFQEFDEIKIGSHYLYLIKLRGETESHD